MGPASPDSITARGKKKAQAAPAPDRDEPVTLRSSSDQLGVRRFDDFVDENQSLVKWMNELFIALMVNHCRSDQP